VNTNQISQLIWSIADDLLRGFWTKQDYRKPILPFFVLKRLDLVLADTKSSVVKKHIELNKRKIKDQSSLLIKVSKHNFYNYSEYDFNNLLADPNNLEKNLKFYLNSFSNNVQDIFNKNGFNMVDEIEKLSKHNRLYKLIEKLNEANDDLDPKNTSNHEMGQIFEELLRRFQEDWEAGEHFTPRDIIKLMTRLVIEGDKSLEKEKSIKTVYDPACGSGGMLTVAEETIKQRFPSSSIHLFGQEVNPEIIAICRADLLIKGHKIDKIVPESTLSKDGFPDDSFDYMISNPPYGSDWVGDVNGKKPDKTVDKWLSDGRFEAGLPPISDGQIMFLQTMISKCKKNGETSRIAIIMNGSPLFNGDAGSGYNMIRKWIVESDLLEAIIALPTNMFFNTGIPTYVWILTNIKPQKRKGKIQLVNAADIHSALRKNRGNKNKEITDVQINEIVKLYSNFKENENCLVLPNKAFGYTKVTVEQPKIEDGKPVKDKQGNAVADSKKRDYEKIPLTDDIDEYFEKEVKPHLKDAYMNRKKDKIGYEINFNKYFYKFKPLRSLEEIKRDLEAIDKESRDLLKNMG
jgi:type I restriction enzyme M protein